MQGFTIGTNYVHQAITPSKSRYALAHLQRNCSRRFSNLEYYNRFKVPPDRPPLTPQEVEKAVANMPELRELEPWVRNCIRVPLRKMDQRVQWASQKLIVP